MSSPSIQQASLQQPENKSKEEIDQEKQAFDIYRKALTFNVISKYDPKINQLIHLSSYCVVYKFDDEISDWEKLDYQGPLIIYSRNFIKSKYSIELKFKKDQINKIKSLKSKDKSTDDNNNDNNNNNNNNDESSSSSELPPNEFINDSNLVSIKEVLKNDAFYEFGLIVLNRSKIENFSLGLIPNQNLIQDNLNLNNLKNQKDIDEFDDSNEKFIIEKNGELVIIKALDGNTYGLWLFDETDRDYVYKLLCYIVGV
ncbi:hypothetical protein B5S32_g644 [[Candida] boidinii]|uniref:Unnamed protein product n=1 Tax=Candida boidinii TaxID=5477 RepID=A0ACB5TM59_CANBO|nr:hypothetical protein B5S32_g644 [[Candida] boidinii]GME91371.1 unnamed protein product [[Candida] boidinii]